MSTSLVTRPISPAFFERGDATQLAWLGMAGLLVNARGTVILVDPLLTTVEKDGQALCEGLYDMIVPPPIQAAAVPRVDWVLYTHADGDHLGSLTAQALAERLSCRFLAPRRVAPVLSEIGIGEERITIAQDFMTLQAGSVEIEVTPALHDWQEVDPYQRGDCCGFLLKTPDGTIWHPGDTRLIDELLAVKGVDVFLFDVFGVETHLGPRGSARLAVSCGAKAMIAYHYGTLVFPLSFPNFDPEDAYPFIEDIPARYLVLNPGEVLEMPVE